MNIFAIEEQEYSEQDAEWDDFVANHPQGSVLQTTGWARLKSRFNWVSRRVWVRKDGKLVAGAQILFRSSMFGIIKIGYIPHGPLVNWEDQEQVEVLFGQIDLAAYQNRSGLVVYEPLLWQTEWPAERWADLSEKIGSRPNGKTIQPPRTSLIDLTSSEDEILGRMKSKTRYNIRLAARKGVTVRQGGKSDLATFAKLVQYTGQRNAFGTHTPNYYATAYEQFAYQDQAGLFLAEFAGQPLAGIMVLHNGRKADYLYGGSNDLHRDKMPTYAVQWAAMKWAKEAGCAIYDMWGVPDADEQTLEAQFKDRSDGLWGVYRFKRGFAGEIARTVGMTERPYNKLLYRLYQRRRMGL